MIELQPLASNTHLTVLTWAEDRPRIPVPWPLILSPIPWTSLVIHKGTHHPSLHREIPSTDKVILPATTNHRPLLHPLPLPLLPQGNSIHNHRRQVRILLTKACVVLVVRHVWRCLQLLKTTVWLFHSDCRKEDRVYIEKVSNQIPPSLHSNEESHFFVCVFLSMCTKL